MSKELVIHPQHYNAEGRKECWEEMLEKFGPEAVAIFDVLSAYKYSYRAGTKEGNSAEQDKAKIENYMHHSADILAMTTKSDACVKLAKMVYSTMKEELKHE